MANNIDPGTMPSSRKDSPPVRVLLVEDHPDLAAATEEFLRDEGLEVQTALSGREALALAGVFNPQLVLCDLNLPDMSGLEVVRRLRSNPATARICIAVLSAVSELARGRYPKDEQPVVDAILVKPIDVNALRRLVEATGRQISLDSDSRRP